MTDLFSERKKALIDARITQATVARLAGVSYPLVNQVMRSKRKSPRVVRVLAQKLGPHVVARLWPAVTLPDEPPETTNPPADGLAGEPV